MLHEAPLRHAVRVKRLPKQAGDRERRCVEHDTFDNSTEWSIPTRTVCGANPDVFLGGACHLAAGEAKRTYTLPAHSRVRVSARLHFFDEWGGEAISLRTDGQVRWTKAHRWCDRTFTSTCTKYGIDACGEGSFPDTLSVPVRADFAHAAPTLEVAFASTLPDGSDPCRASWGLDDVAIELI